MIEPGARSRRRVVVDAARVVTFMGPELAVYGTPNMLFDVEMGCRDLLKESLGSDQDSVGVKVELTHSGAAVIGMEITIDVEVVAVQERAVTFSAVVLAGSSEIGKVVHQRAIVSTDRLKAKILKMSD